MKNEELNRKLENRENLYGTIVCIGDPAVTEAIAQTGFDLLWIDTEHTPISGTVLQNALIAARAGGVSAWVRIPWNDPVLAKPVLDMGADGIIFPYVRTADEARLAVAACTYPPDGVRGYGPMRALDYGGVGQMDFVTKGYRKCRRVIQIEHVDAVKNLREIVAVDGIDAFIIGPNDLSGSAGMIGRVRDPRMIGIYREAAKILREAGKPFGVATFYDGDWIRMWIDLGATIIFCGCDYGFVRDGAAAVARDCRKLFEGSKRENN